MKQCKKICETLKAIRKDIADANEIDYQPTQCTYDGDCAGTCPKCESETRWLEKQLRARQALGKAVTIAGLGIALGSMSSCNSCVSTPPDAGSIPATDTSYCSPVDTTRTTVVTTENGKDANPDSTQITPLNKGNNEINPKNKDDDEEMQIMGDVAVDENGNVGTL